VKGTEDLGPGVPIFPADRDGARFVEGDNPDGAS